jgi:hypothetical protein
MAAALKCAYSNKRRSCDTRKQRRGDLGCLLCKPATLVVISALLLILLAISRCSKDIK